MCCHDVLGCAQTVPTGKGAMKGIMFKKDDHGELETELHYQVRCSPRQVSDLCTGSGSSERETVFATLCFKPHDFDVKNPVTQLH